MKIYWTISYFHSQWWTIHCWVNTWLICIPTPNGTQPGDDLVALFKFKMYQATMDSTILIYVNNICILYMHIIDNLFGINYIQNGFICLGSTTEILRRGWHQAGICWAWNTTNWCAIHADATRILGRHYHVSSCCCGIYIDILFYLYIYIHIYLFSFPYINTHIHTKHKSSMEMVEQHNIERLSTCYWNMERYQENWNESEQIVCNHTTHHGACEDLDEKKLNDHGRTFRMRTAKNNRSNVSDNVHVL